MSQKGKIGIAILVILLILSLAGAAAEFYLFNEERKKVINLNGELDSLAIEKKAVEGELQESKAEVNRLNNELNMRQEQIDELNAQLQGIEEQRNQLVSQMDTIQSKLQDQEDLKKELEASQAQAQEKLDELQAFIDSLKAEKEELTAELAKYRPQQEVSLGKIVVDTQQDAGAVSSAAVKVEAGMTKAASGPAAAPILEGEVLVINKEYGFVIANLGTDDGVNVGDIFAVYQQDKYTGDIKVEKTQEVMSACGFVSADIANKIREGDKIIRK